MNLIDLLQMTKPQAAQQQSEGLGPIMQFLAQSRPPQMPAIQMPQGSKYGQQILAQGLQKQDREDTYAAHLQAKNDMEQQHAQAIIGHEAELSDDPQVQAMLKSGNPQLVTYAMKIAEDEKQKKIAAQYNENPTFARYQQALQENPELAAQMMQWIKAKGTNINLGDKSANDIVWMTPEQKQQAGLDPQQPYAINQKSGLPEAVKPNEFTDAQNQATGYYNRMVEAEKIMDQEMAAGFETGGAKEAVANILPYGLGGLLRSPQQQRVRQAQEDWVRAKLRKESGANIPADEMDREIQTYFPGLNETDPSIIEQKRRARLQGASQLLESTGGKRVGSGVSKYDDLINAAAAKYNIDPDLIRAQMHKESAGNPTAVSSAGAGGLMQLMPGTAKQLGVTNVNDPIQNIEGGTRYLAEQIAKYGNIPEALAAYNAGPGAVDKYNGIPPYKETQDYVKTIVDNYAGSKAGTAKQQRDYTAGLKERALNASSKNSPRNDARKAALEERANKLRAAQ